MLNNKAIIRMTSMAALTVVTASAAMAQVPGRFGFTTLFLPNPINSNVPGTFVFVTDNSTPVNDAAGTGTQINLDNFTEFSGVPGGPAPPPATISQAFTLNLTITPDTGAPQTQQFTGTFNGSNITPTTTTTSLTINSPTTLTYSFGSLGSYTVSNLIFTPPGIPASTTKGALSAEVTFAAVPEASTTVSLGLLLMLGLGGLVVARRKTCKA